MEIGPPHPHIRDMDRTFYDPIQIPPLSQSFSVLAKLIFHYLGHVFWFSGILLLIIMAVHGVVPLTDNLLDGSLAFRSLMPPFVPVEVPMIVHDATLGLMRLMAVSMAGAFVALFAAGIILLLLSVIAAVLSVPLTLIRWAIQPAAERPAPKPVHATPKPQRPDWGTALAEERRAQEGPDLTELARAAGAWTGRRLHQARKLGRSIATAAAKASSAAPVPPRASPSTPPPLGHRGEGMWSEIRKAFRGSEPPNASRTPNAPARSPGATG